MSGLGVFQKYIQLYFIIYNPKLLKENITLNFTEEVTHKSIDADCFEFLKSIDSRYDLIILDPPAFAKGLSAVKAGMRGYETINSHALKGITQGGLLFTFSCSQAISREMFREVVSRSAVNSRRSVKILHELHQAPCHALNPNHPEGEYLKGLVLAVD